MDRNCCAASGHSDMGLRRPVKSSDYIYIWVFLLACGVWFFYPALQTARVVWPPINDPNALLQECAGLLKTPGRMEEADWPPAIRKLSPRFVRVDPEYVEITISTGGIGASWGYLVYPDGKPTAAPRGLLIRETMGPGLFKYETDE
jgi:hypothetical protein